MAERCCASAPYSTFHEQLDRGRTGPPQDGLGRRPCEWIQHVFRFKCKRTLGSNTITTTIATPSTTPVLHRLDVESHAKRCSNKTAPLLQVCRKVIEETRYVPKNLSQRRCVFQGMKTGTEHTFFITRT